MKKYIPNILTSYRILVAFLIPILFFNEKYNVLTILFVTALLTDSIDGILARKWNTTSDLGKILDAVSDKLISLSASSTFIISINKYFFITLILEIIIIIVNCISFISNNCFKNNDFSKNKSSIYGKVKTWALFITLFFGYISYRFNIFSIFIVPLILLTSLLQVITATDYALKIK